MRFEVSPAVFELLPDACFGVVAVKGADNTRPIAEVSALLHESIAAVSYTHLTLPTIRLV